MTKRRKFLDSDQASLDFDQPIETYTRLRDELISEPTAQLEARECRWEEYCLEVAVASKRAIRDSGLSRPEFVDAINRYFGWPLEGEGSGRDKRMTLAMLNNHLCKPAAYPFDTPIIHAICHISGSTEPLSAMCGMAGGQFLTRGEARLLALGKIDNALAELQRIKKTFRIRGVLEEKR